MITRALALLASVALAACGSAPDPLGGRGRAVTSEPTPFGARGLTDALSIPAFGGDSVALWARAEPGTCFALASLDDAAGRAWVSEREPGPYCERCDVRTSMAEEEALFVLPSGDGFHPERGLSLRFGLMRCDTSTPLETSSGERIELAFLPRERAPERGLLSLRFLISEHSMLFDRPDRQRELVDLLNTELDEAGLQVILDDVAELRDVPREASFSSTDLAELDAVLDRAPPALEATVDVVFAGCLRYDDLFGPPVPVDGFTPRVGGGAGPASAVFVPGLRCDDGSPAPYALDTYAHLVAHELGHFLGLYHSIESDGTTDRLDDTGEDNTMLYLPTLARARGFSPTQSRAMRSHPWVRR